MSDENKQSSASSGAAEPASTESEVAAFGTRGSGRLLRGKLNRPPKPASDGKADLDYKPTAISIVTPETREFKTSFGNSPDAKVESAQAEPSKPEAVTPPPSPEPVKTVPVQEKPEEPVPAAVGAEEPEEPSEDSEDDDKASIEILPPATVRRVQEKWEYGPGSNQEVASAKREPRRHPRRDNDRRGRRDEKPLLPAAASRPAVTARKPAKSGGVIGWIKSLFSGAPKDKSTAMEGEDTRQPGQRRRRRRGGRGRGPGMQRGGPGGRAVGSDRSRDDRRQGSEGGGRRRRRRGRGRRGGSSERGSGPAS